MDYGAATTYGRGLDFTQTLMHLPVPDANLDRVCEICKQRYDIKDFDSALRHTRSEHERLAKPR